MLKFDSNMVLISNDGYLNSPSAEFGIYPSIIKNINKA
jgi:hypothetical protein